MPRKKEGRALRNEFHKKDVRTVQSREGGAVGGTAAVTLILLEITIRSNSLLYPATEEEG